MLYNNRKFLISSISDFVFKAPALTVLMAAVFFSFFGEIYISGKIEPHNNQRVMEVFTITCLTIYLIFKYLIDSPKCVGLMSFPKSLWCFFVLGIVSSSYSFSPIHALYEVCSFFLFLCCAKYIGRELEIDFEAKILVVFRFVGVGCILYISRIFLVYIFALISKIQPQAIDFTPGFGDIRFFSHAQTITLPLLIGLCIFDRSQVKIKLIWMATLVLWWTLLFVNGGRGSIFGVAIAGLVTYFIRRQQAREIVRLAAFSALIGLIFYLIFFFVVPWFFGLSPFGVFQKVVTRTIAGPMSGRLALWARAACLIAEHPWLGVGPLHFAHHVLDLQINSHPHNLLLQIAAEWGGPALVFFCAAIVGCMRKIIISGKTFQIADVENNNLLSLWLFTGVAILSDSMVSGLIVMPVSQILIILYISCSIGWWRSVKLPVMAGINKKPLPNYLSMMFLSVVLFGLLWCVWPKAISLLSGHENSVVDSGLNRVDTNYPRMWDDGYF